MVFINKPNQIFKHFIVLLISNGHLYLGRRFKLWKLIKDGILKEPLVQASVALPLRLASCFRPLERAGRLNFRELAPTPKGDLVGVVRKRILLHSAGQGDFQTVLRIKNGGRPKGILAVLTL